MDLSNIEVTPPRLQPLSPTVSNHSTVQSQPPASTMTSPSPKTSQPATVSAAPPLRPQPPQVKNFDTKPKMAQPVKPPTKQMAKLTSKKQGKLIPKKESKTEPENEPETTKRPVRFKPMSRLPIEIRIMIWTLAANTPRLIRAQWHTFTRDDYRSSTYYQFGTVEPSILRVCRESRDVAKKFYCPTPQHISIHHNEPVFCQMNVWINFVIDTFYFVNFPERLGFGRALRKLDRCSKGMGVRNIAFNDKELWRLLECPSPSATNGNPQAPIIYDVVQEHNSLKHVMVVANDAGNYTSSSVPGAYSLHPFGKPYVLSKKHAKDVLIQRRDPRKMIPRAFDIENRIPNPMPMAQKLKFEKFKKKNPSWREPEFSYMKVLKQL